MTPPQARNTIKKALVAIVDPHPKTKDKDAMWAHFDSNCAFCGIKLERASRLGHGDHLIPASAGGRNHLFNRVLACSTCNGDAKLDHDWLPFLQDRSGTDEEKAARKARIVAWQNKHRGQCRVSDETVEEALLEAERVLDVFNAACESIRALRSKKLPH